MNIAASSLICVWRETKDPVTGKSSQWDLMVQFVHGGRHSVATVWPNGTWHTWDQHGTGGCNDKANTVGEAKIMAAGYAIEQGYV